MIYNKTLKDIEYIKINDKPSLTEAMIGLEG